MMINLKPSAWRESEIVKTASHLWRMAKRSNTSGVDNFWRGSPAGFAGSQRNRLTDDWAVTDGVTVNAHLRNSLKILRARSLDLSRNDPKAKAIIESLINDIVGCGMGLQSKVQQLRGGNLSGAINDLIETRWSHWSKQADISQRMSFWEFERLVLRTVITQGEALIRLVKVNPRDSKVQLSLEFIAPQQLDDRLTHGQMLPDGHRMFMGIEVDKWLRPVAYWICPPNATDPYGSTVLMPERVPSEEIIHVYWTEEPHQLRGLPWLYASLLKLRDLSKYEESLVQRARIAANIAMFVKQSDLQEFAVNQTTPSGANPADEAIPQGVIRKLLPGEEVQFPPIPTPDANSIEFIRTQTKHAAVGAGVTFSRASGDFSQNNYSQSRMEQILALPQIRVRQKWFSRQFHDRIFGIWLEQSVLANDLPIADFWRNPDRYCRPNWQPPGIRLQDPEKEADAYIKLIEQGLVSKTWVVQEINGKDYEEVLKEIQSEQILEQKYGVNLSHEQPTTAQTAPNPASNVSAQSD